MEGEITLQFHAGSNGEPFVYLRYNNGSKAATFDGQLLGRVLLAEILGKCIETIVLAGEV